MGLEDDNGMFEIIMRKNEPYPVSFTQRFTTASEDIKDITVHVMQDTANSSLNVSENPEEDPEFFVSLAKFNFSVENITDETLIDICFDIDDSGIVTVIAKDVNSGREADFTLKATVDSDKIADIKIY